MNLNKISSACFLLISILIYSSCSPVKIANIEKRRYRDGYYVQLKSKTEHLQEASRKTTEAQNDDTRSISSDSKKEKVAIKEEIRKMKEVVKKFKKDQDVEQLAASMNKLVAKATVLESPKSTASAPISDKKRVKRSDPTSILGAISAVMAIVFLVVFLVLFLALALNIILVLAVAVIFAIVFTLVLKALGLIK